MRNRPFLRLFVALHIGIFVIAATVPLGNSFSCGSDEESPLRANPDGDDFFCALPPFPIGLEPSLSSIGFLCASEEPLPFGDPAPIPTIPRGPPVFSPFPSL